MSTTNATPPPPPLLKCANQNISKTKCQPSRLSYDASKCKWALLFPELQNACIRFDVCSEDEPLKFRYKHFDSVLQEGPTCGLVAMSILLEQKISPADLLEMAKCAKYSNNGELFSVKNVFNMLLKVIQNLNINNLKIEHKNGHLCCTDVINSLLEGSLLLVPYDSDYNHSPCLKRGHKAHWAIVTGVIIQKSFTESCNEVLGSFDINDVYVTAKQGKSLHLGLWKLKSLEMSNQNLTDFSPDRKTDNLEYILPVGGLASDDGLKGQFIVIHTM